MHQAFGFLAAFFIFFTELGSCAADNSERVALVIGNSAYQTQPLANPANDAKAVSSALRRASFKVIEGYDLSRQGFEATLRRFLGEIEGGRVALVYYSGHGVQVAGRNFMLPVDAKLASAHDLDFEGFDVATILGYMQAKAETQLLFLDACRDNPFAGRTIKPADTLTRSILGRGLAPIPTRTGSLVAFATDPGNVALDGPASLGMSPFTSAFSKLAITPALEVRKLLTLVRREVVKMTDGAQVPWENSALLGDFFFVPPRNPPIVQPIHAVSMSPSESSILLNIPEPYQPEGGALWVTFKQLPTSARLLLNGEPLSSGQRIAAERLRLVELRKASTTTASTTEPIGYAVHDEWGNETTAWVVASLAPDLGSDVTRLSVAPTDEDARRRELDRLAQGFGNANGSIPVAVPGVGPIALNLQPPPDTNLDPLTRIEVIGNDGPGGFWIRGHRLTPPQTLDTATLREIAYLPELSIAAKDDYEQTAALKLRLVGRNSARSEPWHITIRTKIDACDRLAAEPLDLQGVAQGVLANDIKINDAEQACLTSIARYPEAARFYHQLGRVQQAKGDAREAAELFTLAEAKGHIRASYALALIEINGALGSPNFERAMERFRKAADKADPFAMHALGKRLYTGYGVKQDQRSGLSLMLQAAAMGHTFSMNELGAIFNTGNGVQQDTDRALAYYQASAARNDMFGYNNLGLMFLDGTGTRKNPGMARALFLRAYEEGHPDAANNIGRMYFHGIGVPKDLRHAAMWYERSAKRGNPWAANNRAWIATHGPRDLLNSVVAARYYALGAIIERGAWAVQARDEALRELAKLPATVKLAALQELGRELELSMPVRSNARDVADALAEAKIAPTGSDTEGLLMDLTHLAWLRSKPRFDLF